ncbi:hypothetical protein AB0A05_26945 [Streptomyces sp. NPDC046374]|uniref:hypothetical protein n=1 Tax=Streptomyces sp. NPDC046374 TaxID=3154917 RepID=UPI0033E410D3
MATRNNRRNVREANLKNLLNRRIGPVDEQVADDLPPAEPVEETWPPAEPADDTPVLTVPDPRHEADPEPEVIEEQPEAVAPEHEPVIVEQPDPEPDPEPEAFVEQDVEDEVVEVEFVDEEQPEPAPEVVVAPEPETPVKEIVVIEPAPGNVIALRPDPSAASELEVQRKRLLPELPTMSHPPASATPIQKLDHYEALFAGANRGLGLTVDLAKREMLLYLGFTLEPVRDDELWKADPDREFKDWDDYCQQQWGFSADYANKQIRARPIIEILRSVTAKELKEGTLRPLIRVRNAVLAKFDTVDDKPTEEALAAGAQAVLDTWFEAESYGSTSAANLEKAAKALGFIKAGQPDPDDIIDGEVISETENTPDIEVVQVKPLTAKEKAETWLKPLADTVATDDTKELAAAIKETRGVLERLELQLKERQKEERARVRAAKKAEADSEQEEPEGEPVEETAAE